jgi:hypothetical protein
LLDARGKTYDLALKDDLNPEGVKNDFCLISKFEASIGKLSLGMKTVPTRFPTLTVLYDFLNILVGLFNFLMPDIVYSIGLRSV